MALVDLKSKLNEFGRNNPDNPYQKGDKRGDLENSTKPDIDKDKYLEVGENPESDLTELDSKYDRDNTPKSAIVREETSKTRLNHSNIFTLDRLNTNKNFESGLSTTLGFDYEFEAPGKELDFSIAQIINEKENQDMPSSSSLDQRFSDVVGESALNLNNNLH